MSHHTNTTTALQGSTINTAGSILASAAPSTPSSPATDLTKPERDAYTVVVAGGVTLTIENAIAHGYLARNAHGALYEVSQPQPPAVSIGGIPQVSVEAPIEPIEQQDEPKATTLVQRARSLLRL